MNRKNNHLNRSSAFDAAENNSTNPTDTLDFFRVAEQRYQRRDMLRLLAATGVTFTTQPSVFAPPAYAANTRYVFPEVSHGVDTQHHVAKDHQAEILIRWGDPLFADSDVFDPYAQSADAQEKQFGYNNDFIGWLPIDEPGNRGLLVINHEFTNEELMFPGIDRQDQIGFPAINKALADIEMAAHGVSVVEIRRDHSNQWRTVVDSSFNRRITPRSTMIELSGPAAGDDQLKTSTDPTGRQVVGTLNNCAGGVTPWGTVLSAEENFNGYFWGSGDKHPGKKSLARYGAPNPWYNWGEHFDRFNIEKEPNEINRFGWIVEIDPYDPTSIPKKRTALGRFKHEGASPIVNGDRRVVVYMGDDQRFDYLYRFVSRDAFDPDAPASNRNILDHGTLYVAKFNDRGSLIWLPLVWSTGPLTSENGFASQADVLINTRLAADLLGATPMDRPEDVEPNPQTNRVYVMLTNNHLRSSNQVNSVNPRGPNYFGHIVELIPPNGDHAAPEFSWDLLVRCGDPAIPSVQASWGAATSSNGWFASPDNCVVDPAGRLWVATDQGKDWALTGTADGLWGLETEGPERGSGKMFFRAPVGAEVCGPAFSGDGKALFLSIQHPAADGVEKLNAFEKPSTFESPATRWPDYDKSMPPRPSVVVVTRQDGGEIALEGEAT